MNSIQIPSAGQAHLIHPETLRQANLRRFGLPSATARTIAHLAFGDLDEPWSWIQLETAAAMAIDSAAEAYEARP